MQAPDLTKWEYKVELEGLLFFSQLVNELLFDYTIDTYKIPALNSHSLASELLSSIEEYELKFLKKGALKPIVDELIDRLNKDYAIKEILKDYFEEFLRSLNKEPQGLKTQIEFLINKINIEYFPTLKTLLKTTILGVKEKEKITRFTRDYLIELINKGYSPQYIYHEANRFFFAQGHNPQRIDNPQIIDAFLNLFSLNTKHFNVIYKAARNFGTIKEYSNDFDVEFLECPPSLEFFHKSQKPESFFKTDHDLPCYLTVKDNEALDPFKARAEADGRLFLIDSLAKYHIHRGELRRSDDALVYSDTKEFVLCQKPKPPVMKRPDKVSGKLSSLVKETISTITSRNLDQESLQRLIRAFWQHNTALRSENPESQLLEFWSAIEVLFPPTSEDVDRISPISDSLAPFMGIEYAAKLAVDLYRSLKLSKIPKALEILSKVPEGDNEIEKILALFSIEKNKSYCEELYVLLERQPLLKNRIYFLSQKFSSAGAVLKTLNAHTERITWQISRIYRARNLIIHSGRSVAYVNILVENLHSYLDRTLDVLNEKISRSIHKVTIDQIVFETKLQLEAHLRTLKSLGDTHCTPDNYKLILFGNR